MRIQRPSSSVRSSTKVDLGKWARLHNELLRFLLTTTLGIVLAVAAGVWYRRAGYKVIDPILLNQFARPDTPANDLPTLHLTFESAERQTLAKQRAKAWQQGLLQSANLDWTLAQIQAQGKILSRDTRIH